MPKLSDLLDQGLGVTAAFGTAREALEEWKEAIATAKEAGDLSSADQDTLNQRLEAVHAESQRMSQELDQAIEKQRRG